MDIIDKLISFFQKPKEDTKNDTPEGLCPVCWGHQQFDGKIRVLLEDKQIDINNHKIARPFFEEIITKHVDGVKLKEAVTIPCPDCNNSEDKHNSKEEKTKPIKRTKELQPLSREHHHGLLLCWKIRQGIKLNVEPERIKKYLDWFWMSYLKPHFEVEEKFVFPVLGNESELVKNALVEHRRLKRLFETEDDPYKSISLIEEELERHIRFEERVLFNKIQAVASRLQLLQIERNCSEKSFYENLSDPFWE